MKTRPSLFCVAAALAVFAAACGDDVSSKSPTPAPTTASTATTQAQITPTQPTASSSATKAASPPADGTVDPLGGGQQTPWTVKGSKDPFPGVATVSALRMGLHPELGGWERIVFEFAGADRPQAVVRYVGGATSCGSGQTLTTQGSAILEVAIDSSQAHNNSGQATIPNTLAGPGGTVITGGVSSCDFEGHVWWEFGLNGKHDFKVSTLANPTRIVIDIKQ